MRTLLATRNWNPWLTVSTRLGAGRRQLSHITGRSDTGRNHVWPNQGADPLPCDSLASALYCGSMCPQAFSPQWIRDGNSTSRCYVYNVQRQPWVFVFLVALVRERNPFPGAQQQIFCMSRWRGEEDYSDCPGPIAPTLVVHPGASLCWQTWKREESWTKFGFC